MKRMMTAAALLLAAAMLLTGCAGPKLEGKWNATGGVIGGMNLDVSSYFGESKVEIAFSGDHFTLIVEDSYTKDYACTYMDGAITFDDTDEYIAFSNVRRGETVTFRVQLDGDTMTWTLPEDGITVRFVRE